MVAYSPSLNGLFIDGTFQMPARPPPENPVSAELERICQKPHKFKIDFLQDTEMEAGKLD